MKNIKWPWVSRKRYDQEMADYEKETYDWHNTVIELEKEIRHLKSMNEFLTKELA